MTLEQFNKIPTEKAAELLFACCGSERWKNAMLSKFPFSDASAVIDCATSVWYNECNEADWMEAFTHHPKIGDVKSLSEKFAVTEHMAGKEQAGINEASADIIHQLKATNNEYEARFGFIFIICASGKKAGEMLRLIKERLKNTLREELNIAMGEQSKITILRLQKTLTEAVWDQLKISQLTTHVLDTTEGKPAADISIRLKGFINNQWEAIAQGITNQDGRITDLLPQNHILQAGNYKMVFETADYFFRKNMKSFYPAVEITFSITDAAHYHIPLLLSPFGYSTYRGS